MSQGAAVVFETVLPQYVNGTLYQMLLEARASEHSSRMVAMKNATDNAKQMLKDLSLEYNKLRQAAITNELLNHDSQDGARLISSSKSQISNHPT